MEFGLHDVNQCPTECAIRLRVRTLGQQVPSHGIFNVNMDRGSSK